MIVTIQGVQNRLSNIKTMLNQLPGAFVHIDENRTGAFNSFKEMVFKYDEDEYRLHLQDDIIIPDGFMSYVDKVLLDVIKNDYHVTSLFVPKRKAFENIDKDNSRYVVFDNFLWMQAIIISPFAIKGLKDHFDYTAEKKHDDVFVQEWLKKNKIKAYAHFPSIVQHNVYLGSEMGNANSKHRMSPYYDKNFCNNQINE